MKPTDFQSLRYVGYLHSFNLKGNGMSHGKTYGDIVATTYNTPLVKLNRIVPAGAATVLVKLEFFNPCNSVKDRIGRAMIEAAEKSGRLTPGNAHHRADQRQHGHCPGLCRRGERLLVDAYHARVDESRTAGLLRGLGANLVLTPAKDGMKGAIAKAEELAQTTPNAWIPQQFDNPANPDIHERTTGPEIWEDTAGKVDILVAGVGTGGTITGATRYIRTKKPDFRAIAVEPTDSPVISGGKPGPHKIQGIGAGFIPKNLDTSLLSGVETVTNDEAFTWARRLAKEEGILAGISSGGNVAAAIRVAARPENRGKVIVTIIPSFGERYLSTPLFEGLSP